MRDHSGRPPSKGASSAPVRAVIYLTGFGPFGPHIENASEAAVNLVSRSSLASDLGVQLVTDILDVDYAKTQNLVPRQWDQCKPQLVVHVGVSGLAKHLTLEQYAFNTGYTTQDILQKCPPDLCCIPGGDQLLKSELPLESISEALNKQPNLRLKSCLSQDPGRYLCSFVYYTSLHKDRRRVVFVHVPPLDVCPAEDTAHSLREAIVLLYRAVEGLGTASSASCNTAAEQSSEKNCGGSRTCANASGKDVTEKHTEFETIQGKGDEREGNKNLSRLNSAMEKMSTSSEIDEVSKGDAAGTAQGSS